MENLQRKSEAGQAKNIFIYKKKKIIDNKIRKQEYWREANKNGGMTLSRKEFSSRDFSSYISPQKDIFTMTQTYQFYRA